LTFAVVLVMGTLSYATLPRQQDPSINFNWIEITTLYPGAAAEDVEKQVTDVLEDAIAELDDIRFVASSSREGVSSILVRFEDIADAVFAKRVTDLRREIQNQESELPAAAEDPTIREVTSANAFPVATVIVSTAADDENLRRQADNIEQDLERLDGVDSVLTLALQNPELQVRFDPARLSEQGLSPVALAETVGRYYRDLSAGSVEIGDEAWLVRLDGARGDPAYLAGLPVIGATGEIPLDRLARVERGRSEARELVRLGERPAVLFGITKQADTNLLQLVERIRGYLAERNRLSASTGVRLTLADDQTEVTRRAIDLMQNNALVGLGLVLAVTWLFLGTRIALLTCIGIPFILAGTFWLLGALGQTLNVTVLLGVVISLGMLVDDAVVVVEAIYYRLARGLDVLSATLDALREVAAPVTTAVLTTMAAFLPLMLLPGILGKFMLVIPLVVTAALAISLVEAYWMLPAHVLAARVRFSRASRMHRMRTRFLHGLRIRYTRLLLRVLRRPRTALAGVLLMIAAAAGAVAGGMIRFDFFASDPLRLFYVNIEMPVGTPLRQTLAQVEAVERRVREHLRPGETRAVVAYAGQMFTETEPRFGDQFGQILVGLQPDTDGAREVDAIIESMRADVTGVVGPLRVTFLRLSGGPPVTKPISVKARGDDIAELRRAVVELRRIMAAHPAIRDISDDDNRGLMQLELAVDRDAAHRAEIDPLQIARTLRLLVDGEVVTSLQDRGETVDVRVRAARERYESLAQLLGLDLPLADGGTIPLGTLVETVTRRSEGNIRHYDFRRAITIEADIDRERIDTVQANDHIRAEWAGIRQRFPNTDLDFSGVLDDIQESLDAMTGLFLLGLGLIYLILGTQFRSYFQPLMILATVPMAFTGVV
ncbi:MAG: efflux RND transporter permease subunit, partial [Candidatus Competibacterales bacterium]|nr:efflux RND transporter permease subunit [Candidatus Competibacterales bacterium]